jgi:hypothetical protein
VIRRLRYRWLLWRLVRVSREIAALEDALRGCAMEHVIDAINHAIKQAEATRSALWAELSRAHGRFI